MIFQSEPNRFKTKISRFISSFLPVDYLGLGGASEEFPDDFNIGLWHIVLLFVSGRSNLLCFLLFDFVSKFVVPTHINQHCSGMAPAVNVHGG
jgi:hypothetical protein